MVIPPVTRHEIDLRLGGKIRLYIEEEETAAVMEGGFKEISKPGVLVYTWEWLGSGEVTTVRIGFAAIEGGTKVSVRHTGFLSEESREAHESGWDSYCGQLAQRL